VGGGARVLLAVVCSLCVGCSAVGHWAWPSTTSRTTFKRTSVVRVQSSPPGARVSDSTGKALGNAPVAYRVRYNVSQVYKRHSNTGWLLGCVADAGIFAYALAVGFGEVDGPEVSDSIFSPYGALLGTGMIGTVGCVATWARRRGWLGRAGVEKSVRMSERITPKAVMLRMRWPGGISASKRVTVPLDQFVTVMRPGGASFDDAILTWHLLGGQATTPRGLYHLGLAYMRRYAVSNAGGDRRSARKFLQQYLDSNQGGDESRAKVRRLLQKLGSGGAP